MPATALKLPPPVPVPMTSDEFMAWVDTGPPGKKWLVDGIIFAMAPASPTHGTIQAKLAIIIGGHFLGNKLPCRVITEGGIKPHVRSKTNVRVPDLTVTCGPVTGPKEKFLIDPLIVIEVLSPSNDDDTGASLTACSTVPSVREMLLVDSSRVFAEVWRRDATGNWPSDPDPIMAGGMIRLEAIDLDIHLDDLYAETHLAATNEVTS